MTTKEYSKKYYELNKESIKEKKKEYGKVNSAAIKQSQKKYKNSNKDKLSIKKKVSDKLYYEANKEEINSKRKIYRRHRTLTDPLFQLSQSIRANIRNSFKRNGFTKNGRTVHILGCSFEDFKLYLESRFEIWMTWDNYGKYNGQLNYGWDFDHIIPSSSAINEEEILKLNHYTNLQPLCSKINRDIKKGNTFSPSQNNYVYITPF